MKTPRDYFFEIIKKKGDIEIRSSITAQINEEDFILVMEEYANLKVNAVLPQANVSGSLPIDLNKEAHLIRSAEKHKHPLPSSFGGYRWHEYIKDAMEEYAQNYAKQVLKIHGILSNDP